MLSWRNIVPGMFEVLSPVTITESISRPGRAILHSCFIDKILHLSKIWTISHVTANCQGLKTGNHACIYTGVQISSPVEQVSSVPVLKCEHL